MYNLTQSYSPSIDWPVVRQYSLHLIILLFSGLLISAPILAWGVPDGPDLSMHIRVATSFYTSIQEGNLLPSWLAESNSGYGDPGVRFYPPVIYYLLSLFYAITGTWYLATVVLFTSLTIVNGIAVYLFARELLNPNLALLAGLFYSLSPFHVNELFQASLIAEYAAAAPFALTLCFIERIIKSNTPKHFLFLTLSFALLLLTHIPMALIGSVTLFIYTVVRIVQLKRHEAIRPVVLSVLAALGITSFYWAKFALELDWILADKDITGVARYDYRNNFIFQTLSLEDLRSLWATLLGCITVISLWPALLSYRTPQINLIRTNARSLIFLTIFSFLMATPLSIFIWKAIPRLGMIEYPWRWLAITSLFGSVALAASLPYWLEIREKRSLVLLAAGSIIIGLAFTVMQPVRNVMYIDRDVFNDNVETWRAEESRPEWKTVWTNGTFENMDSAVDGRGRAINILTWGSENRTFEVGAGIGSQVRVRTQYYPHWRASALDTQLSTNPAPDGSLLINLPQKKTRINLEFKEPVLIRLTYFSSLLILLLVIGLTIKGEQLNRVRRACGISEV
jgi:uncharacterized membrane protein